MGPGNLEGSYSEKLRCALFTNATSWNPRRDSWGQEERVDATKWQQNPECGAYESFRLRLKDSLVLHMQNFKQKLQPENPQGRAVPAHSTFSKDSILKLSGGKIYSTTQQPQNLPQ